jgi:hypothetical protein
MSLAELKEQAAVLPPEEQAELAAFVAEQLRRKDPAYQKELTRLMNDRDPKHWQRWSEVKLESAG